MARFVAKGTKMNYTSSVDLAAGDVVSAGSVVGIAEAGCKANETCALTIAGVFEFTAADAVTQGAKVYLTSAGLVTTETEGNTALGVAMTGADAGGYISVKLNM